MSNTIWDRYGGYSFVAKAVDDFYARVLLSQNLVGYFEEIDMEQLISHHHRRYQQLTHDERPGTQNEQHRQPDQRHHGEKLQWKQQHGHRAQLGEQLPRPREDRHRNA